MHAPHLLHGNNGYWRVNTEWSLMPRACHLGPQQRRGYPSQVCWWHCIMVTYTEHHLFLQGKSLGPGPEYLHLNSNTFPCTGRVFKAPPGPGGGGVRHLRHRAAVVLPGRPATAARAPLCGRHLLGRLLPRHQVVSPFSFQSNFRFLCVERVLRDADLRGVGLSGRETAISMNAAAISLLARDCA